MILESYEYKAEIQKLGEREKELKCLYKVQEIISRNLAIDDFLMKIARHIWGGWQFPMITRVKITFEGKTFREPGWEETQWKQQSQIIIDDKISGYIEVFYTRPVKMNSGSPFLPEEQKLLDTIAAKVSQYIFNLRLVNTIHAIEQEKKNEIVTEKPTDMLASAKPDIHWHWRFETVKNIAAKLDMERFGVKAIYLIGSVKVGNSGPASDIDILIHFEGNVHQRAELSAWFEGWSLCLANVNCSRTGYSSDGLIDLHIVTDEDIQKKDSFASMINSRHNPAKLIKQK
jgi:hypothetical protein